MNDTVAKTTETLLDCIFQTACDHPDREALVSSHRKITYLELSRLIEKNSIELGIMGIDSHSVVGIQCGDDIVHLLLLLSAAYNGATTYTLNEHETPEVQSNIKHRCHTTHVINMNHLWEEKNNNSSKQNKETESNRSSIVHCKTNDSFFYFTTSGTTGTPKIVMHKSSDLLAQAHRHINSSNERFACLASVEHNFSKRHRLFCLAQGGSNIFLTPDLETITDQCINLNVNVLHLTVFQAQQLLTAPEISRLKDMRLKLGGSLAPIELRDQLKKNITSNLQAGYGTTETGAICFTDIHDTESNESVGKPLPGIEIDIIDENNQSLSAGEKGHILIRANGMFRGYLDQEDMTKKCISNNWFNTGDIGYKDNHGRLYLCGRGDDMFMFNSVNIYPQELESVLLSHSKIEDAIVIPKPSIIHGNIPVALIALSTQSSTSETIDEIKQFASKHLGIRCPKDFIVTDKIPRNATGKIMRTRAYELSTNDSEVREAIINNLQLNHALDEIHKRHIKRFIQRKQDILLRKLHLDSIAQVNLQAMLETKFNVLISPQLFSNINSLNELTTCVLKLSSNNSIMEKENDSRKIQIKNTKTPPYIIRLFRRMFSFSSTVAHLNKFLSTLTYRLTPLELYCLKEWNDAGTLLSKQSDKKFHIAVDSWLNQLWAEMLKSGKNKAEPFAFKRILPSLYLFSSGLKTKDKALIICFSIAHSKQMAIPNPVLLQHTDASQYDLLMVGAPHIDGFDHGIANMGNTPKEVIEFVANLTLAKDYRSIRTIGCSAGATMAVLLSKRIDCELACSLGAVFHKFRHPARIASRLFLMKNVLHGNDNSNIIFCYSHKKRRDSVFATLMSFFSNVTLLAMDIKDRKFKHTILDDVLDQNQLSVFLESTIYCNQDEVSSLENRLWSFSTNKKYILSMTITHRLQRVLALYIPARITAQDNQH